ncbi:MAG: hypothetical protein V2B18_17525 [Pseudomonadota bacterium]
MNKLIIGLILVVTACQVATAQYDVAPAGAFGPDGGLQYVLPTGTASVIRTGPLPISPVPQYPISAQYWVSYPFLAVPTAAGPETSDK